MIVHMDGVMSAPEVGKFLGVSERRVRAMIADGQLPAERIMGRWAISAQAVASYHAKPAGRPLAEQSAWVVLQCFAGHQAPMSARLRNRVAHGLAGNPEPHRQLHAWMAARGKLIRAWAFKPAMDRLLDDERVVVSGDHAVDQLEPSGVLRIYINAADADIVLIDHGVKKVHGDRIPNIIIWAVNHLADVPRQPDNYRAAADIVTALDLLDDGDARAVDVAWQMIGAACLKQMQ